MVRNHDVGWFDDISCLDDVGWFNDNDIDQQYINKDKINQTTRASNKINKREDLFKPVHLATNTGEGRESLWKSLEGLNKG